MKARVGVLRPSAQWWQDSNLHHAVSKGQNNLSTRKLPLQVGLYRYFVGLAAVVAVITVFHSFVVCGEPVLVVATADAGVRFIEAARMDNAFVQELSVVLAKLAPRGDAGVASGEWPNDAASFAVVEVAVLD